MPKAVTKEVIEEVDMRSTCSLLLEKKAKKAALIAWMDWTLTDSSLSWVQSSRIECLLCYSCCQTPFPWLGVQFTGHICEWACNQLWDGSPWPQGHWEVTNTYNSLWHRAEACWFVTSQVFAQWKPPDANQAWFFFFFSTSKEENE